MASCYCGNSNGMLLSLTDAIKQETVYVYVNLWQIKFHRDERNKFRYHGRSA
ncbi:hypothetical protein [uncultured Campylobacter sp.]|uniref:hypothetical protein n=1 Tax=uncultured Campylobacter sp. TaxID=218934 RepID=UPI00261A09C1|nr:hypothetical protein [uncultured Campylobacter sp.]